MSDEYKNELFPEPERPDPPADSLDEIDEEELDRILTQEDIEENAFNMETALRDMLCNWMFEVLLTLINPTPASREKIIISLVTMAKNRIETETNSMAGEYFTDSDERAAFFGRVNEAFKIAQERFLGDVAESMFDDEVMERIRKSIRKNLSR